MDIKVGDQVVMTSQARAAYNFRQRKGLKVNIAESYWTRSGEVSEIRPKTRGFVALVMFSNRKEPVEIAVSHLKVVKRDDN